MVAVAATDSHLAIDAVWRIESPRIIAGLTRMVRDVGLAEDLAHDALVTALERAASLTQNVREREMLLERAHACTPSP